MVMPINHDVDGQVWIGGDNEYQVDVKTGEWKTVDYGVGLKDQKLVKELSSYGVASDSKNNFYGMNLNGTYIIRVDAKTKAVTPFKTPTPNAGPRRGHMDAQDRLFFAEFRGNKSVCSTQRPRISRNGRSQRPGPTSNDAISRQGRLRLGRRHEQRPHRPASTRRPARPSSTCCHDGTNVRRVNVDNGPASPVFWIGNTSARRLIKVEPIE
jgi:hypothetical protein